MKQSIFVIEKELKKISQSVSDDIKNSYIDINSNGTFGLFAKKPIQAGVILCEVPKESLNTKFNYINISNDFNVILMKEPLRVEAIKNIEEHDEILINEK